MTDKYACLPPEKQRRILLAVWRECGRKSYEEASTNAVAAASGIAKGSVFAYFGSKKGMYLYAAHRAMEVLSDELYGRVTRGEGDFFARASQVAELKLALLSRHPPLADFLLRMVEETAPAVAGEARALWGPLVGKTQALVLEGLDESLFRGDIPFARLLDILQSVIGAYEQKVQAALKREVIDEAFWARWNAEWEELVAVMRKLFCKGGEGT